jgi:hypothetical protein
MLTNVSFWRNLTQVVIQTTPFFEFSAEQAAV